MANNQNILNAIENGYEFRISNYISKAFDIFKTHVGEFIGFMLVYFVISMFTSFIPIVGTVIGLVISPALSLGALIVAHRISTNQNVEFSNFFDGFKKLGPLVITYLMTLVIYIALFLPIVFIIGINVFLEYDSQDPSAALGLFENFRELGWIFVLFFLVFLYVVVSLRWSLALVYFYDYQPLDGIIGSWKLVNIKWFHHLGFLFICGLIALGGMLALVVGLLVAIPVISIADYVGFADVTKLEEDGVIDQIGLKDQDLV